ncbi:OmpA family protein [Moritella viscosa]
MDAMGALANTLWSQVDKKTLPDAMVSGLEFMFGISSTKAAFDELQKIRTANTLDKARMLGVGALLRSYVFDPKVFFDNVGNPIRNGEYGVLASRVPKSWFLNGVTGWRPALSSLGFTGLNAVSSFYAMADLADKNKQLELAEKLTKKRKAELNDVAHNYLKLIPLWNTQRKSGEDILQKLFDKVSGELISTNKATAEQVDMKDSASLFQDGRGAGLKLLFHFDARDSGDRKSVDFLDGLAEIMNENVNISVEIEGHADQNGTSDYNLILSNKRANFVANKLKGITQFDKRVHVAAYGESKVIAQACGDDINRDNPALKINRRVEVRIYVSELALRLPPSRSGFEISASNNEEALERELALALFESAIGVASFIPGLAVAARGMLLVKESTGLIKSASQVLDATLLDYYFKQSADRTSKISGLEKLAKQSNTMLRELAAINEQLGENNFTSIEALSKHLNSPNTAKELIKRYKMRALALNGLFTLIAQCATGEKGSFNDSLVAYDLNGYIKTYIEDDTWVLDSYDFDSLASVWLHQSAHDRNRKRRYEEEIKLYGKEQAELTMAKLDGHNTRFWTLFNGGRPKTMTRGAFNNAFPVQDKLFVRDDQNGLLDLVRDMTPFERKVEIDEIGFVRLLVADPKSLTTWVTYEKWQHHQRKSGGATTLSPLHRLKWQIVLWHTDDDDMNKRIFQSNISYRREIWFGDVSGPKFTTLFHPMALSEFSMDCDKSLATFFDLERNKTKSDEEQRLVATEFEPFYYWGEDMIKGVKPLVGESELNNYWQAANQKWLDDTIKKLFSDKEKLLTQYNASGGFKDMDYVFTLSGKHYDIDLSAHAVQNDNPFWSVAASSTLSVGLHTECQHKLTLPSGFGNEPRTLNERDLLVPEFVLANEVKKGAVEMIIEKPDATYVQVSSHHKSQFLPRFNGLVDNIPKLTNFNWSMASPFTVSVLFVSEKHNKSYYEGLGLDWKRVSTSLQLGMQGENNGFDVAFSSASAIKGPSYQAPMNYLGSLKKEKEWVLATDNGSTKLTQFETDSIAKINDDNNLSDKKEYVVYSVEFNLNYISLAGNPIKGLRPFGDILHKKDSLFKSDPNNSFRFGILRFLSIKQVNTATTGSLLDEYTIQLPNKGSLQSSPFSAEGKIGVKNVNKDLATKWKGLTEKEQNAALTEWITQPKHASLLEPLPMAMKTMASAEL